MKTLFKKPEHVTKGFYKFVWFTIFALLIGIITKVVVVVIASKGIIDIQNAKQYMSDDDYQEQLWNSVGILGLQVLIIIATIAIYPLTIASQLKVMNKKKEFNSKVYKTYKKEFIIFLVIFLFLDLTAIAMLVKAAIETGIDWNLDLIFAVVSVFIPTPIVIGQMIWLKKFKNIEQKVIIKEKYENNNIN